MGETAHRPGDQAGAAELLAELFRRAAEAGRRRDAVAYRAAMDLRDLWQAVRAGAVEVRAG